MLMGKKLEIMTGVGQATIRNSKRIRLDRVEPKHGIAYGLVTNGIGQ